MGAPELGGALAFSSAGGGAGLMMLAGCGGWQ
jgi:hypothetical protein